MSDKIQHFKAITTFLGFTQNQDKKQRFSKTYLPQNYTITVDFETEKIEYPAPLTLGDKTTSNFSASENFVVLECLDRLLEKGYKPEFITLEKIWGLGHKGKGKADIFVTDTEGKAFLIIECKTWGAEFNKEFEKMLESGGQLFGYYQQDRKTEFLCLYASVLENDKIRYTNRIIEVKENWAEGGSKAEVFKIWKNGSADDENTDVSAQSVKFNSNSPCGK
jgi:type I restriction enzyme M protein